MSSLTYYIATTLDGFIARKDGSFDAFPNTGEHIPYFMESLHTFKTVIMGRKTYDVGLQFGVTNPYPHLNTHVFSNTLHTSPDPSITCTSEDPVTYTKTLKSTPDTGPIWLCGGGTIAALLLNAGLIDQITLKVNPVVLGSGIPAFPPNTHEHTHLSLVEHNVFSSGVTFLTYNVQTPE